MRKILLLLLLFSAIIVKGQKPNIIDKNYNYIYHDSLEVSYYEIDTISCVLLVAIDNNVLSVAGYIVCTLFNNMVVNKRSFLDKNKQPFEDKIIIWDYKLNKDK